MLRIMRQILKDILSVCDMHFSALMIGAGVRCFVRTDAML